MANEQLGRPTARVERLCAEAREKLPGSALADALENLHREIVRKLMHALRAGIEVRDLAIDLQLVTDESRRLQQRQDKRFSERVSEPYSFAETCARQSMH